MKDRSVSPSYPSEDVKGYIAAVRLRNTRIVAWLVFFSKVLSLASAVAASEAPPSVQTAFLWIRVPDLLLNLIVVLLIQFSSSVSALLRFLLLWSVISVIAVEITVTQPLSGWAFSWVIFAGAMGSLIAFDSIKEYRWVYASLGGTFILGTAGLILHPFVSFIPPNSITHGMPRFVLITVAVGVASYLVFRYYQRVMGDAVRFADDFRQALEAQWQSAQEALQQKDLAEKRQQELEAALKELARLREEERQRADRESFLMRYETLMRTGYELSLPLFAQKVLDELASKLQILGSLFYQKGEKGWQVISTQAFPDKINKVVEGGILQTAAILKKPYTVCPVPEGTQMPYSALASPKADALLYLPLYSEVTGEVVAIAELLLANKPTTETLSLLEVLLPRLGTFLWNKRVHSTPAPH
ncbi:MAG: hypothetical protein RMK19_06640 [Bacteroidia bacterium]|nr:hypothetical protein [Bacteroidia bacterium]MDW8015672.1 hypothetical protein [Bacteroidia bacterium]